MNRTMLLQPIDIYCGDSPAVCPFDGTRTELLEIRDGYTVECCPKCRALLNVWDEDA